MWHSLAFVLGSILLITFGGTTQAAESLSFVTTVSSVARNANPPVVTPAPQVVEAAAAEGVNPFVGYTLYANNDYRSAVHNLAIPKITNKTLIAKAIAVADVPSFFWLDSADKVPKIAEFVSDAKSRGGKYAKGAKYAIPLVVYDLPDRDCAAFSSNGEYSIADGGAEKYPAYIDSIRKEIEAAPDMKFILVIEPDSLANLVTNMNVQKCKGAESAYRKLTNYAIKNLNLNNVAMYLDSGHAGWLGWDANLAPAAKLFASIYNDTGRPATLRGLATNVANYNAWKFANGCPHYAESNKICDESRYINKLGPMLRNLGFPAHFIVDTSRNGVQPTKQNQWGDWCNVIGTGFGLRPSTNTSDPLVDSFVWIKPGGQCDGTSDATASRFDAHCAYPDALQPAPEAGTWFQDYFVQLLKNANPPL